MYSIRVNFVSWNIILEVAKYPKQNFLIIL
jgi:hypothetical protein